ncbi:mycofactocin biosynthesis peptidyl-dipeptidase MftE [Streptomyces avicenniae]|uniref:mycofactocin biosynthesis peptidyl-dipeptidase MftE n=1 Tax=Streptomyces avicenniae TaxID=500153 RepID=UPI00069A7ACA|nr:mycofactocin biosynthesis peptidyl-dipeptidase MftE [Streptomyces avicenniae]
MAAPDELARAVWPSVPRAALVLVPVGSTEQHGPHLPLTTDTVVARAVTRAVAAHPALASPAPPLVAPALAYGASGEHAGFPGTVSIGHEALRTVLVETVRSLALWADRVVFLNGHGGNVPTLADAVPALREEGHDVAWTLCAVSGGDAHAGRTETSLMLHLAPDEVRLADAVAGDTRPIAEILPDLRDRGVLALSPSGVLGDPAGASADEGARIMERIVAKIARRVAGGAVGPHGRLVEPGGPGGPGDGPV